METHGTRPAGIDARSKLTRSLVERLPTPAAGSYYVYDAELPRLAVRVWASGRRFYTVRAYVRGAQRWTVIGEHGQPARLTAEAAANGDAPTWVPENARREATRILGIMATGADPDEAKRLARGAPTLREAARLYVEDMRSRKRPATLASDESLLGLRKAKINDPKLKGARRILDEPIAGRRLPDIRREDVEALMRAWKARPIRANRALALLSHLFSWARVEPNPCRGVARNAETKRKRYLSGEELSRLGKALGDSEADATAKALIRMLLFTGARRGELLSLRWKHDAECAGHVDRERNVAVLHASKTGAKDLQLPPAALTILDGLPKREGNPFVFASHSPGRPIANVGHEWAGWDVWKTDAKGKRVREHVPGIRDRAGLADVRIHDLRHSFASFAVAGGASLPLIGGLLGHTQPATTQRYAHLHADPLARVADTTSAAIAAHLDGRPAADVVELKSRRRRA